MLSHLYVVEKMLNLFVICLLLQIFFFCDEILNVSEYIVYVASPVWKIWTLDCNLVCVCVFMQQVPVGEGSCTLMS